MATLISGCGNNAKASGNAGGSNSLLVDTSSDRQSQLTAAAQKEGALSWVTSFAGPVVDDIVKGFEAKYPYIKVSVNRGDEGVIIPQAVQAINAGKSAGDVFEVTASGALEFNDARQLQAYASPNVGKIPDQYVVKDSSGHFLLATDRISYVSFGYNKSKVSADAVPKTLQDLLNPSLKGLMAIENNTTSEDWVGAIIHKMGQSQGEAFLAQLAKQDVKETALSGSALMGLVASGQYGASPSVFHNHEQQAEAKGSPTGWVALDPVVANVGQLGVLARAQHPASAVLFIDYLTSPDGQKVLEGQQYTSPEDKQPFEAWIPSQGAASADAFNKDLKSWAALQKKYFG